MKIFKINFTKDIQGNYELRCTLKNEEQRLLMDIRGLFPAAPYDENSYPWARSCKDIDITYLADDYDRNDILIGLAYYLYWAADIGAEWAEICLSNSRCAGMHNEIRELVEASPLSSEGQILVDLNTKTIMRLRQIAGSALKSGEYGFVK